jgi:hypothetical protein
MCTGEYVTHSKNVRHSYLVRNGEDLAYAQYVQMPSLKDSNIWPIPVIP